MSVTFLHTADLHLGKTFDYVAGDPGANLRQRRLDAIDRLAQLAAEHRCAFVLIAGDVFDAPTVDDRVLVQATERFGRFPCPVYLIPGNHDPDAGPGSGSVWRRPAFANHQPAGLQVLADAAPVYLAEHDALLLPAPLRYRSVAGDPTAHLTAELGSDLPGVTPTTRRIGLAHGSVVGFTSDADGVSPTTLAPDRAARARLDYLALGDWHGTRIIDERTAYAGTPEPTGFRDNGAGQALLVTLGDAGATPTVLPVDTAATRWLRETRTVTSAGDVQDMADWFDRLDQGGRRASDTLVRLELSGSLPLAELQTLDALLDRVGHRLIHLRRRGPGVLAQPTDEELDALAGDGYLRDAVMQLRATLDPTGGANDQDRTAAADALHLLHRLQATSGANA